MVQLVLVMAGGAVGAGLRFLVGIGAVRLLGGAFPWGTLIVNVAGGLAMGLLAGSLGRDDETARLVLGVGVLGGFTTFSAFGLETATMLERGAFGLAALYALTSVVASVAALFAGLALARVPA